MEEWLRSPQTSLYYSLQVLPDTQDKTDAYSALADSDIEQYLGDILNQSEPGADDEANDWGRDPEPQCDCQE